MFARERLAEKIGLPEARIQVSVNVRMRRVLPLSRSLRPPHRHPSSTLFRPLFLASRLSCPPCHLIFSAARWSSTFHGDVFSSRLPVAPASRGWLGKCDDALSLNALNACPRHAGTTLGTLAALWSLPLPAPPAFRLYTQFRGPARFRLSPVSGLTVHQRHRYIVSLDLVETPANGHRLLSSSRVTRFRGLDEGQTHRGTVYRN